jgi:hypothetical protein
VSLDDVALVGRRGLGVSVDLVASSKRVASSVTVIEVRIGVSRFTLLYFAEAPVRWGEVCSALG